MARKEKKKGIRKPVKKAPKPTSVSTEQEEIVSFDDMMRGIFSAGSMPNKSQK